MLEAKAMLFGQRISQTSLLAVVTWMAFAGAAAQEVQVAQNFPGAQSFQGNRLPDAPFVPTSNAVVQAMQKLAGTGPADVVYDLGSGDGRIVITAARDFGARGVGIDINP